MELIEIVKKLKKIEANADYTRKSRQLIVSNEKNAWPAPYNLSEARQGRPGFSFKHFAANLFQSGSAIAMTAMLLFLVFGTFSLWKIFSPTNPVAIELTGLQAEARAIDIQIQLTNIAYQEQTLLENKTSTVPFAHRATPLKNVSGVLDPKVEQEVKNLGLTPVSSSTSVSINEALDSLSQ